MEGNPYSPPVTEFEPVERYLASPRKIAVAWERLRIRYNVIMLVAGILALAIGATQGIPILFSIPSAVVVGIGANVCFFLGPVTEFYACAFRDLPETPYLRQYLFNIGVAFSLFLFVMSTLVTVMSFVD